MTAKVVAVSSAIEMITGVALFTVPAAVVHLLLGENIAGAGTSVARLTGIGLYCLGLAYWQGKSDQNQPPLLALFLYNLLAALYLAYLRFGGGVFGSLLLPACLVHGIIAILLARPTYQQINSKLRV